MPEAGVGWFELASRIALVAAASAFLWVLVRAQRSRELVGEELAGVRAQRPRATRAAIPAGSILVIFAWCLGAPEGEDRFAAHHTSFETLALLTLAAWFAPVGADRAIGRDGLLVGRRAWRWNELTSPRLEGAVLVFEASARAERVELSPELLIAAREVLGVR